MNSAVMLLYFGGGCLALLSVCGASLLIQRCLRRDALPRNLRPPRELAAYVSEDDWDVARQPHPSARLWTVYESMVDVEREEEDRESLVEP